MLYLFIMSSVVWYTLCILLIEIETMMYKELEGSWIDHILFGAQKYDVECLNLVVQLSYFWNFHISLASKSLIVSHAVGLSTFMGIELKTRQSY